MAKNVDWNIVLINILKQPVRTGTEIELWPSGYSFPMLYVASYNELQQLHMQVLIHIWKFISNSIIN